MFNRKAQEIIDRNTGWNARAVLNALMFLEEMPAGQALTLQVPSHDDIPYLKRIVISALGQPSRFISNRGMSYSGKIVQFVSLRNPHYEEATRGYRGHVFYIPRVNNYGKELPDPNHPWASDWKDVVPYPMWQECGLCLADVYNLVVEDAGGWLDSYEQKEWLVYVSERG